MVNFSKKIFVACVAVAFSGVISAASTVSKSWVAGYWETVDGKTGKPSSIIHIKRVHDLYEGKIVKIFTVTKEKSTDVCKSCVGDQKDQPILGLTIISEMECDAYACKNGMILDPRDGDRYHATMQLIGSGDQLKVHGYIGIPLFGKTVIWNRVKHS